MNTIEEKRQEALERLKLLKENGMKYDVPIRHFKNGDIGIFEYQDNSAKSVYYAMRLNSGDVDRYDEMCDVVENFEKEHNAVVYLILVNYASWGELWHLCYVTDNYSSDDPEECMDYWEQQRQDILEGYMECYCYNRTEPMFSDYGDIAFKYDPAFGGIYRSA